MTYRLGAHLENQDVKRLISAAAILPPAESPPIVQALAQSTSRFLDHLIAHPSEFGGWGAEEMLLEQVARRRAAATP